MCGECLGVVSGHMTELGPGKELVQGVRCRGRSSGAWRRAGGVELDSWVLHTCCGNESFVLLLAVDWTVLFRLFSLWRPSCEAPWGHIMMSSLH